MNHQTLSGPWAVFEKLQSDVARNPSWEAELALTRLVDSMADEDLDTNEVERRFHSLRRNLRRRERTRGLRLRQGLPSPQSVDPVEAVFQRDTLEQVRSAATLADLLLLTELAQGADPKKVAHQRGRTPGAFKTHVCRMRRRLRDLLDRRAAA